jgi:hypothetical protein
MHARGKLNVAYAAGSTVVAAVVGGATGSWALFALVLMGLLASNVALGEIRFSKRRSRS